MFLYLHASHSNLCRSAASCLLCARVHLSFLALIVCLECYFRPLASPPIYYPGASHCNGKPSNHMNSTHTPLVRAAALLVLSTVTATRLLRVPFIEQLRLVCGSLLLFVVLVGLSSLPARAHLCVWLVVGALAPLIGIRANERIRRRAFAENLATRYAGGAGGRQLQEPPVHSCRDGAAQATSSRSSSCTRCCRRTSRAQCGTVCARRVSGCSVVRSAVSIVTATFICTRCIAVHVICWLIV